MYFSDAPALKCLITVANFITYNPLNILMFANNNGQYKNCIIFYLKKIKLNHKN